MVQVYIKFEDGNFWLEDDSLYASEIDPMVSLPDEVWEAYKFHASAINWWQSCIAKLDEFCAQRAHDAYIEGKELKVKMV